MKLIIYIYTGSRFKNNPICDYLITNNNQNYITGYWKNKFNVYVR